MITKHEMKSVSDLFNKREKINLNPSWQRGPVWPERKQSLLIDSILRDYDIPKIYLRKLGSSPVYDYEAVDGQQRLRSLWRFIDGEYSLSNDLGMVGTSQIAGKHYSNLPEALRKKLKKFKVSIVYLEDAKEPEVSILFSRMQMGVRLNPAELRNAVQSGLRHAIDGLARTHPFFKNSRIPSARYKHQDYLSHAVSLCYHQGKNNLKAPQLMKDYQEISSAQTYVPIIEKADIILDLLEKINRLSKRKITQKWIFVDLFYLFYRDLKNIDKISPESFSKRYIDFDNNRLKYNSKPEALLENSDLSYSKYLYNYIASFKISGAESKNIENRHDALVKIFSSEVGY